MAITDGYTTLLEVKAILRITDEVEDNLLETCIEAASRQIDTHCERVFSATTETRVFAPDSNYLVSIDDLSALTELKTSSGADGTFDITWSANDIQLEPLNGKAGSIYTPYTRIRSVGDYLFPTLGEEATVKVTGTFGYGAVIPTDVKQACNLLAIRQFKRYDSPLGVAGFGDIGVVRVSRVDPDIEALLGPYRKMRMA
jgi:hypothetical protein